MSCIATFYQIPISKADAVAEAKSKEKKTVVNEEKKKFLIFTKTIQTIEEVGEVDFNAFIESECSAKFDYEYSGYLLVNYLWLYLELDKNQGFKSLDEYWNEIRNKGAVELRKLIGERPLSEEKIRKFFEEEEDSESLENFEESYDMFQSTERIVLDWIGKVTDENYGLLHLSF